MIIAFDVSSGEDAAVQNLLIISLHENLQEKQAKSGIITRLDEIYTNIVELLLVIIRHKLDVIQQD